VKVLFINDLTRNVKQLKTDIKDLAIECKDFMKLGDITLVEERSFFLGELEEKLKKCFDNEELYNSREAVSIFPKKFSCTCESEECLQIIRDINHKQL
jgi:hypothetical protein